MKCLAPYRMKNPLYPEESELQYIDCGCGKCYPCLVNRRQQWLFRLEHESLDSFSTWFVTLTYDDCHCDGFVHRDHLQRFFKRLRHHANFRYYAIGEYGTTTFRPHYHSIIFVKSVTPSFDGDFSKKVLACWSDGFSSCYPSSSAALNYVLHYHVRPKEPILGKKTFFACSKRLGVSFLFDDDGNFVKDVAVMLQNSRNRVVSDYLGRKFVLPRYYVKKAEESGMVVKKPLSSNFVISRSNTLEYVKRMLPDLRVDANGYPINYSMDVYNSIVNSFDDMYKRKLKRYNYQNKNFI